MEGETLSSRKWTRFDFGGHANVRLDRVSPSIVEKQSVPRPERAARFSAGRSPASALERVFSPVRAARMMRKPFQGEFKIFFHWACPIFLSIKHCARPVWDARKGWVGHGVGISTIMTRKNPEGLDMSMWMAPSVALEPSISLRSHLLRGVSSDSLCRR